MPASLPAPVEENAAARPSPTAGQRQRQTSERAASDGARPPPERKASRVFQAPALAAAGKVVTEAEIAFFVANGFLVKKGLLAHSRVDAALERAWRHLLDRVPIDRESGLTLRRDDPATWRDPRWAPMPPVPKAGCHEGRQRIVHTGNTVKLHDLGAANCFVELLPANPGVRRVATALLGDLRPSRRTRGVYALFPKRGPKREADERGIATALQPHTDQVCQQLNVCTYLDDVPPRCGGFTVYPGSHRLMFRAHRLAANWSPRPDFRATLHRVIDEIEPVEIVGGKGDVVFWHGRTVHSAGAHFGAGIRWALFADFTHDRPVLSDDEHRALGQYEWFKDTKLFRDDIEAEGDDMWQGWRLTATA